MSIYKYRIMRNPSIIKMPPAVLHENGNITLCLPLPARSVSPNAQTGNSKIAAIRKSRATKMHKLLAKLELGNALLRFRIDTPSFIGYSLAFFFRTSAYRDDDNADASFKAYRDGLADALGVNDRNLKKLALSTHAKDATCPRVEVMMWKGMNP